MVVFCCDGCGETLKKSHVDAHAAKCRNCYAVSCVDCSISFPGDEYRDHTSCISEAERYEKTVYRGVRKLDQQHSKNKKLSPQEAWNQTIAFAAETAPPSLHWYMNQLAMMENVPRKEKQFRNFTLNSLKLRGGEGKKIQDEIWSLLVQARDSKRKQKEEEQKSSTKEQHTAEGEGREKIDSTEDKMDIPDKTSNHNKTNIEPQSVAAAVSDEEPSDDAKMGTNPDENAACILPTEKIVVKAIKKALKKAPNKQLKVKALRKQIQDTLLLKGRKNKELDKKWKKMFKLCVESNPKKLLLDGKTLTLAK